MSHSACLVCEGSYGPSTISGLVRCRQCGFVSADLQLSHDELAQLYSHRYFAGEEYRDYVAERALIERQFRARLARLQRFVPSPGSKRLFEIGAAYGFFLSVARDVFQRVEGIDIAADAAAMARESFGLPVATGDFLDHRVDGLVDVVCLWDTIEHLARPDLYVQKAAAILEPGGVLALTTGDIESLVARTRGAKWRQIHPPTHLHYFSRATLTRLLERFGFRIRYVGHEGMTRSVDTMAYILLTIKRRQDGLYRVLKRAHLLDWHLHLNLRDILFLVAERT
jgi:2-polyprenyl-3-methyl-5-hydroxy-6-metoxy-1,4-benzoquinol methylase